MSSGWLSAGSGSAESNAATYLGVSPPISVEQPSETDRQNSTTLLSILQEQGLIESRDDAAKREAVLGKLNLIIERWARKVSIILIVQPMKKNMMIQLISHRQPFHYYPHSISISSTSKAGIAYRAPVAALSVFFVLCRNIERMQPQTFIMSYFGSALCILV